jgi:hypothetical protein
MSLSKFAAGLPGPTFLPLARPLSPLKQCMMHLFAPLQDGDRFWRMPECYVRGNTIKYLRVPDEVIDKVQEETIKRQGMPGRPFMDVVLECFWTTQNWYSLTCTCVVAFQTEGLSLCAGE